MASARVGSPIISCHAATGSWLVTIVERTSWRSSRISRMSRRPRKAGRVFFMTGDFEMNGKSIVFRAIFRSCATIIRLDGLLRDQLLVP